MEIEISHHGASIDQNNMYDNLSGVFNYVGNSDDVRLAESLRCLRAIVDMVFTETLPAAVYSFTGLLKIVESTCLLVLIGLIRLMLLFPFFVASPSNHDDM